MTRFELVQSWNHSGLNGTCLPFPAHLLYFMPKVRLELTTKATSVLCSTNWASQAYGGTRSWTWESDVQSQCFTKLYYTPLYIHHQSHLTSLISHLYIYIQSSYTDLVKKFLNIRGTTWTFTAINQQNSHCLNFSHEDWDYYTKRQYI